LKSEAKVRAAVLELEKGKLINGNTNLGTS
jgi:hypothetical protein